MGILIGFWSFVAVKATYFALHHTDGCFYPNFPDAMKEKVCHKTSSIAGLLVTVALKLIWCLV